MSRDKKRVLITGAGGQLGQEVVKVFTQDSSYRVIPKNHRDLDITDKEKVGLVLKKENPNLIIHCAAWTNVDDAAENPTGAMRVNGDGTKNVCTTAKKIGAKLVYISTNEVFNGKKSSPYTEGDNPNPINSYGQSKLTGEKYCQEILADKCTIVRSSWLYGSASRNNFPNKVLKKAKGEGFLRVVKDEISIPTYTPDLAEGIKKMIDKNVSGIFHLVNEGAASRFDWAREILKVKKIKVPVTPVKLVDYQRASSPPGYSVLANTRAKNMEIVLRDWQAANKEYLRKV